MTTAFDPSTPASAATVRRTPALSWSRVVCGEPRAAAPSTSDPADRPPTPGTAAETVVAGRTSPSPPLEGAERVNDGNAAGRRPGWNVPANGASEGDSVMSVGSWPALSELAMAFPRSSSSSQHSNVPADGSNGDPVGSVIVTPPPMANSNDPNPRSSPCRPNSTPSSMDTSSTSSASSTNSAPVSPQPTPTLEEAFPVGMEVGWEPYSRDHNRVNNTWDRNRGSGFAPQHHSGSDRHGGYNRNRQRNNGGGGFHHGNHGRRQDHEWGGYDWNASQGFNGRDPHMTTPLVPQWGYSRPFLQQSPYTPVPFIGIPPHVQPFVGGPMGFPDVRSVYYVAPVPPFDPMGNVPSVSHQPPTAARPTVFLSPLDHTRNMLMRQIEYYFSRENLCKDSFLRVHMDDQGWIPVSLIASFNRVRQLSSSIPFILDSIRGSLVVEVQDERVRRRSDWMDWILPRAQGQNGVVASPLESPATSAHDQSLGLDEGPSYRNNTMGQSGAETVLGSSSVDRLRDGGPVESQMGEVEATQNQNDPSV
ncbi:la-related protein 1B-like [Musa acuminata AAA Group]|uniref:la-related protein 1B-like n=1 Tax=Musa acuminata AAA Group TaxID=214697 RepID=UPI0031DD815C